MRLVFAGQETADVELLPGTLSLGASGECDIALAGTGWLPHHASIVVDQQRGLWLQLEPGATIAHVNARPVRECAMLRPGDIVSLGAVQFSIRLRDEEDGIVRQLPPRRTLDPDTSERVAASRAVLRGVAGPYHGRTFALTCDVLIGSAADNDVRIETGDIAAHHARIELHRDRVVLRAENAGNALKVNGALVENAVLHPGDQIALDQHRFVVEAPGLPPRGSSTFAPRQRPITQAFPSVPTPLPGSVPEAPDDAVTDGRFNVWWLLVAAIAIALALLAILLYGAR